MSRTTRRRLNGWNPGEEVYERYKALHAPGVTAPRRACDAPDDFTKNHWFHGRDAYKGKLTLRGPMKESPNCYNGWDDIWGRGGRRWAKRLTGRYRRIVGAEQIAEQLWEDE